MALSWSSWTKYWLRPAPLTDLAIVRILTIACQLFVVHLPIVGLQHASWGPDLDSLRNMYFLPEAFIEPLTILQILYLPFGGFSMPPLEFLELLWWITLIAGLFGLIGLLTNPSLLVFTFGSGFLQALQYSVRDIHHAEAVMMIALALLALSPSGAVLSVDNLLRHARSSKRAASLLHSESSFAVWPILLIQWIFVLMYLSGFASKVIEGGLSWANGYTLQAHMIFQDYRLGVPLALWIAEYNWLLIGGQWSVLLFQATFVLAVLFPGLRWVYLPIGLGFHITAYLFLGAYFYQWIVLYAVFIPWSRFIEIVSSRVKRHQT